MKLLALAFVIGMTSSLAIAADSPEDLRKAGGDVYGSCRSALIQADDFEETDACNNLARSYFEREAKERMIQITREKKLPPPDFKNQVTHSLVTNLARLRSDSITSRIIYFGTTQGKNCGKVCMDSLRKKFQEADSREKEDYPKQLNAWGEQISSGTVPTLQEPAVAVTPDKPMRSANSFLEIGGEDITLASPRFLNFDGTPRIDENGVSYIVHEEKDGCIFTLSPVESFPYRDGYRLPATKTKWQALGFRQSTTLRLDTDCDSLSPIFQKECRRNTFNDLTGATYRTPNELSLNPGAAGGQLKVYHRGSEAQVVKCLENHGFNLPQVEDAAASTAMAAESGVRK